MFSVLHLLVTSGYSWIPEVIPIGHEVLISEVDEADVKISKVQPHIDLTLHFFSIL